MKTNDHKFPKSVLEYFAKLGYLHFQEECPNFGGVLLYLGTNGGRPDAAYYLPRSSAFEAVTSDELRRAIEFVEERGISLRYAVTNSRFSSGADKLAIEAGIITWPRKTS